MNKIRGLNRLLSDNSIDINDFESQLYKTLLLGVFEAVCKDIKKANKKVEEKEKFRKATDKYIAIKMLINRYTSCALTLEDYEFLLPLFKAFFNKNTARKIYEETYKQELLKNQNHKCNICNKKISLNEAHLDHIIPWDYVGDIINNNLQMLCETCNTRKGAATYYETSMLLLNKKDVKISN